MMKISQQLPLKRAFITGAGSGLGKAFALQLAADGWTVGITDINETELRATAELVNKTGRALPFVFDVADENAFKQAAERFLSATGGVDLLINNAGVGDGGVFEEYSLENWKWIVGINQMGVVNGCHFFVPVLKKQKSGCIINIASAAAFSSAGTMSPYNATKAAVLSLSETLFAELRTFGVSVSVVMPTFFKTNIMQHSRGTADSKRLGQAMINQSKHEADEIASRILRAAAKRKFYVVLPAKAKVLFVMKRLFPSFFLRFTAFAFKNRDRLMGRK